MRQYVRPAISWAAAAFVLTAGCASAPSSSGSGSAGTDATGTPAEAAEAAELEELLQAIDTMSPAGGATSVDGEYRIGAHDLLEIVVFDAPELSGEARVSGHGDIAFPLLGPVSALGSTPSELAADLETRLRERYMRDPHVTVQLLDTRARPVYVLGEVNRPGAFELDTRDRLTVLQAVAMGGGLAPLAARGRAVLVRTEEDGTRAHIAVNLEEAMEGDAVDTAMQPNDVLFVPRSSAQSLLRGAFNVLSRIITLRAIF